MIDGAEKQSNVKWLVIRNKMLGVFRDRLSTITTTGRKQVYSVSHHEIVSG